MFYERQEYEDEAILTLCSYTILDDTASIETPAELQSNDSCTQTTSIQVVLVVSAIV
jgi:hypothetical protein